MAVKQKTVKHKKKPVFNERYNEEKFTEEYPEEKIKLEAEKIRMTWSGYERIKRSNGMDDDTTCKRRDLIMSSPIPEVHT